MVRADTGCRPLINQVIKRFILYKKNIESRKSNLCHDALVFERENTETPNFCTFSENFTLDNGDLAAKSKAEISRICDGNYDRFWREKILDSAKAISFNKFKTNIAIEPHLVLNFNRRHKIAISRFRMSNHALMIEKGRHQKIERNERKCYFCKNDIEDELHFLVRCPLYSPQRKIIQTVCNEICVRYKYFNEEQKFIFLFSNENELIIKALGKFIFDSLYIRDKIITYFFS